MFTKFMNEITFSDVEDFCREFGEGVRVEYKLEVKHIPKIVSSFANTQGGIFIIGAETDKTTNKVNSIPGIPKRGGLEEQIIQSAVTGIYPAVLPEVIILDVPTNPNNVVVVIRIDESVQAPHAIQNSTRVYIRTDSITQPHELAEIDRIEYLLKRRENSQETTRRILNRIDERALPYCNIFSKEPNQITVARPVFPYRPIMTLNDTYEIAKEFLNRSGFSTGNINKVSGGVFSSYSGTSFEKFYQEFNEYGIIYRRGEIRIEKNSQNSLDVREMMWEIALLLMSAGLVFKQSEYSGNIEIEVTLQNIKNKSLNLGTSQCYDSCLSIHLDCTISQNLLKQSERVKLVEKFVEQVLWSFNYQSSLTAQGIVEKFFNHTDNSRITGDLN